MKFSKHSLCRTAALLIALLLTALCAAPAVFAARKDKPTVVKVGYYENEVFEEGAQDGTFKTGYAYEYYIKLSEYTGWNYEYVYGSFADLYQKLIDGEIDVLAGLAYTEERKDLIGYPDAPMGSENYSLLKHDTDDNITALPSTMNGHTFGVLNSAMVDVLNDYLTKNYINGQIITYDDYADLFAAFDNHEIDILAAEGDGAYGREHAEVICPFGVAEYYLCVSNKRPDLLAKLNWAQTMLTNDEPEYISNLNSKYYPVSVASHALSLIEKAWLNSHGQMTIGYLDDFLPYSSTDKNGNATGLVTDYLDVILKNLYAEDIEVNLKGYKNYDEMVASVREGTVDAAFPVGGGIYYSEQNGIHQSNPVITSSMDLVYKGSFEETDTVKTFAINENNKMQYYYVLMHYPESDVIFYGSIDECLSAVMTGAATCSILNGLRSSDIMRSSKYDGLSVMQLSANDERCFGVKIGNEGLLKLLNRGIKSVGSEYAQNLAYRYHSGIYKYTAGDFIRDNMALFASIILVFSAAIIFFLIRDIRHSHRTITATESSKKELEEKHRELARSREALADALAAAEHANRAKTTFLNSMSHDIRTPMNAIVGFTAMAAAHIDNTDLVKDYLSKITVSSRHLLSLINDVLDMSRIESGKMTLDEAVVHLPDLIHDLRAIIQSSVAAKQLDLNIDTQDVTHEDIITDKLRLSQVLLNILNNAIKFTPSGGMISFRIIEKPSASLSSSTTFEFRIKDNGIGMSEEFQKNIFEAFTREKSSTVSGIQGTGLGMAISKSIVDMMNGTISVNSVEGKGSEFIITIPCRTSESPGIPERIPELEGLRALVADDDTDTCLSICSMLRTIGMRPDWTNYGKEAIVRAKEAYDQSDKFRVYIIDWIMPDLNGIETVRRIRRVIGDDDPIIVLTAYDWKDIEQEARDAGVTAFCSKPLFMSELRKVLMKPFLGDEGTDTEDKKNSFNFEGKRVLLAEDNELNRIIAVSILEGAGFTVDVACDGDEAVDMVKAADSGTYDAILMDIQMPRMDGYEATALIRALDDEQKANIPIVAVTANAFEEDRRSAIESGMNGHLAKPYDIPMMMETLSGILNG